MESQKQSVLAQLVALPGVHSETERWVVPVDCPLCGNQNVAMLSGSIDFVATMGGEEFFEGHLAAFICSDSHVFFLRQQDAILLNRCA